ncbi:nuclease-related domain-containing protein [Sporichthya polymorpha]|uniref:nuclease-related domain-containing protein n=1 Tax=Sporichthya polymorpha TaxID=35751 RepID=UPI00035C36D3|nr:nuclease-related domain-containing protein [Sporichthya polymorpha]
MIGLPLRRGARRETDRRRELDPATVAITALPDVLVLHNRRLVGSNGRPSRETVDHLVVARSGVWLVDAKTHYGPHEVRRTGGIITPRDERLFINYRDRTELVDDLRREVVTLQRVLVDAGHTVGVHGALCFVDTPLPWVSESITGIALVDLRGLTTLLTADGDLDDHDRAEVRAVLNSRCVPA